jgi:hypothetical protein
MSGTTFVTAFMDLREDRSTLNSIDTCFSFFDTLAKSGIQIHLFLCESVQSKFQGYPNVYVETIELEELETYKTYKAFEEINLPKQRTLQKDTEKFMILMNAKTEYMKRAMDSNMFKTQHFAWIDFSICYVFKETEKTLEYLKRIGNANLKSEFLAFPGCWNKGVDFSMIFQRVNWRFCGGFFIGDRNSLETFCTEQKTAFLEILQKHKSLVWEVNTWAYMENTTSWTPSWWKADHNDSIIMLPSCYFA